MTQLRQQFERHISLHRLSPKTHKAYMSAVKSLALHYKQSPDKLTDEQLQDYLDYIIVERKLAWNTCNVQFSEIKQFWFLPFRVQTGLEKGAQTVHSAQVKMTLDAVEFIRRFLLHILPKGFKKIRHFGFLALRYKAQNINLIRQLTQKNHQNPIYSICDDESLGEMMQRLTGINIKSCPKCGKGGLARLYKLLPEYGDYILPPRRVTAWYSS